MKKILLPLLLILAAWTCNQAIAATATGSFNYDFTTEPACTTTLTADCIARFEIWDVTSTPTKKLATVPVPNPATSPINFSFKVGAPYGSRKWAVQAVSDTGTPSDITAPQAQATVTVRPGAPAAFTVNLQ